LLGEVEEQVRLGQDIFGNKTAEMSGSYIRCFTRTPKRYRFVMYGFCSKIMCLYRLVFVIDNRKDTSFLQNLSIFLKITNPKCFIVQAPS